MRITDEIADIVNEHRDLKDYYPTPYGNNPIHAVTDWDKVASIMQAAVDGEKIPFMFGVWIDNQVENGNLITGTHRAAAHELLQMIGEDEMARRIETDCIHAAIERLPSDEEKARATEALATSDFETLDEIFDRDENRDHLYTAPAAP